MDRTDREARLADQVLATTHQRNRLACALLRAWPALPAGPLRRSVEAALIDCGFEPGSAEAEKLLDAFKDVP